MTRIPLPAIDGRVALGFLAALGTIQLVRSAAADVRLSWSPDDATAVLHSEVLSSVDDVVDLVRNIVDGMESGVLVPGGPAGLPPARRGLLVPPEDLAGVVDQLRAAGDADIVDRWVASLVTDLAVDAQGRCRHTLYGAFSGQQTIGSMFSGCLEAVRRSPDYLEQAFTAWQRVSGVTGEYLDHNVLFSAADASDGQSSERGVPGATWLALMAFPLIRTTSDDGERAISTGWYRDTRSTRLRWPLWREPLDIDAVVALWESPQVTRAARSLTNPEAHARDRRAWGELQAIGVFEIGIAERRKISGRTFAGVLAPVAQSTAR